MCFVSTSFLWEGSRGVNTCSSVFPQICLFCVYVPSRMWTKDWVSGEGAGEGRRGRWVMGGGLDERMMGGSLQGTAGWLAGYVYRCEFVRAKVCVCGCVHTSAYLSACV